MGATTKTTAVGIFVLIALALGVAAIAIFGGGRLFEKRIRYVVYFEGSVTGLNVGSPVTFRGVKVGSVSDIQVTINHDEELVRLPVYIDINPDRFSGLTVNPASGADCVPSCRSRAWSPDSSWSISTSTRTARPSTPAWTIASPSCRPFRPTWRYSQSPSSNFPWKRS
jgi:sporulation protein YlmC with PRC-barrel domain